MMNCPYCLSEVAEEASVCKICTRDLYLFKPMMARVADLEDRLAAAPSLDMYELRIAELENLLEEQNHQLKEKSFFTWIVELFLYLLVPSILLLLAHWLITVVYDAKMIYLRIISMALPLPFAYFLFKSQFHKILPWFTGVVFLAIASVIGMSWITSLVDMSPVWPQNLFEWREVLEYSASIAFSFLTGMVLGSVTYSSKQRRRKEGLIGLLSKVSSSNPSGGVSLQSMHGLMKAIQEYGGTAVALGTTAVSIYTGLKGIF